MRMMDLNSGGQYALKQKRKRDMVRDKVHRIGNTDINLGEQCFVQRINSGKTIREVAKELGVSHVTIIKRERNKGHVDRLARYWRI